MGFFPLYALLGVGLGFIIILYLYDLRLAIEFLVTLGKVAALLFLVYILGGLLDWWDLPRPVPRVIVGLRGLWEPFQGRVLGWFRALFE